MTAIDDRPTLGERYSAATESSNLRVKEVRGDVDYLIAAGWGGTGIGPRLLRLRGEFDAIKGDYVLANRALIAAAAIAEALEQPEADAVRESARLAAVTASALIMVQMGDNLAHVKGMLGDLAVIEATKQRFMQPDADAARIAGRCLDVWLDPTCPKCEGRGYDGGGRHDHTGPKIICRACSGTGKRRTAIGRDGEERRFAARILSLIEAAADLAETGMGRVLRNT